MRTLVLLLLSSVCGVCAAQEAVPDSRLAALEQRIKELERIDSSVSARIGNVEVKLGKVSSEGTALFVLGIVCALWAQNTNRGPWRWFFFGLLLGPIAAIVMLYKNRFDQRTQASLNEVGI